jgi:hypothetical protein
MLCRIVSPVSGTRAKIKAISTVGMDEHALRDEISAGTHVQFQVISYRVHARAYALVKDRSLLGLDSR